MQSEKLAHLGPILARIGETAMQIVGGKPDGVYLYVEIGDGWVGPSLYKDEGAALRYYDVPYESGLCALLTEAWELEPSDKRWTGLEYMIDDGRFDVKFLFDLDLPDDGSLDRRDRIMHPRFGNKQIIYPPWPHRR